MAQIKPLSAELQKIACDELEEIPSRIPEDLATLKLWIQQQPHLQARTDDQFLIQFLRGCKYSLEKAKAKIDHFHAMKTKYPQFFSPTNVDDVIFRECHNLGVLTPLPIPLNDNGPRILFYRFNYPTNKFSLEEIFLPINAMHEVLMISDAYAGIHGITYLVDLGKATASHFLHMSPGAIKRIMNFYEKSRPLRIRGICYINASSVAEQFFKAVLSCLSEKLRERVAICGKDISKIYSHIPQKYLPQDYGGSNGCLQQLTADYNKVWDEHRLYFKQNSEFGTNESLRPGKPLDFDDVLGIGGSFRKLNVD
ncbi:alpha-tocopherol transfer protein-like [Stomoxys calcitrans]|uniref:CRAL-TRIO domain-containing protein n=1 Tax=Stomoxys calcitrans TaxID=35570 RepID=A0A1I8NWJ1_STOCA|nr:alpha-tocopherol transfer protein-like [Stomoxys calcitrans]